MAVNVVCIGITNPDWAALTSNAKIVLRRSVTSGLEKANQTVGPISSFIAILGEMRFPGESIPELLKDDDFLRHAYASFMVTAPNFTLLEFLQSELTCMLAGNLLVASGTFDSWIRVVTKLYETEETEQVMQLIRGHFERIGMRGMFHDN